MANKIGRPRSLESRWEGLDTPDAILASAAELFTTRGFTATSTRALAEHAGIRQATIYHYFTSKKHVFLELLNSTVRPSVELARNLLKEDGVIQDPDQALRELILADCKLLLTDTWNVAVLYDLPEATDSFNESFHQLRKELKDAYRLLAEKVLESQKKYDGPAAAIELPIHLVESLVRLRKENIIAKEDHSALARSIADAALTALIGPSS